jgi:hypothetical protein
MRVASNASPKPITHRIFIILHLPTRPGSKERIQTDIIKDDTKKGFLTYGDNAGWHHSFHDHPPDHMNKSKWRISILDRARRKHAVVNRAGVKTPLHGKE